MLVFYAADNDGFYPAGMIVTHVTSDVHVRTLFHPRQTHATNADTYGVVRTRKNVRSTNLHNCARISHNYRAHNNRDSDNYVERAARCAISGYSRRNRATISVHGRIFNGSFDRTRAVPRSSAFLFRFPRAKLRPLLHV